MHVCIATYKRFLTEKINGKKFFRPIGCQSLQNCPQNWGNFAEIIPEGVHKIVSVEQLNVPAMKS